MKAFQLKYLTVFCASLLLASCGGGGGGGGSATGGGASLNYARVGPVLSNGAGVGRATEDGVNLLFYAPEINDLLREINSGDSDGLGSDFDLPNTQVDGVVRRRSGSITEDGITIDVTIIEDTRAVQTLIGFFDIPNVGSGSRVLDDITLAAGERYTNPRTSGQFTYIGTQAILQNGRVSGGNIPTGNFRMTANFGSGSFSYTTTDDIDGISVSGTGNLNANTGIFSTNALTVGTHTGGTLRGQLYGSGGRETSGVFHTRSTGGNPPAYVGAFVGARQ